MDIWWFLSYEEPRKHEGYLPNATILYGKFNEPVFSRLARAAAVLANDNIVAPANRAIEYRPEYPYDAETTHHSQWAGGMNAAVDSAWEDLLEPSFARASRDELILGHEDPDTSLRLDEGQGYMALFGVYHTLHCLRELRNHLYRGQHNHTIPPEWHLDHCIDTLRDFVMCNVDTTMWTFHYKDENDSTIYEKADAMRQCVIWDKFEEFAKSRALPKEKIECDMATSQCRIGE
ncbi:MAG: hypothetical protein M1821_004056 [Bathelium mastoideum]|nr:MAG: hypothetical protein M1821_004056 [Bathelium mastoideum]